VHPEPPSPAPALQAVQLVKRYRRGALALDHVSLSVETGSITALVGPNAAGKSTLMKTWVGFERPTDGRVLVHGVDPWSDLPGALAHIGYVPQQPALYRGLSIADHLDVAAHLRPAFDRHGALEHLHALGIPVGARPTSLSGGQAAQVMLAIALNSRADVLILDEPLASLDPLARSEFLALLRTTVRARGATAILSSHIVTDMEEACDRLIVLGLGCVVLDDSIEGALASHRLLDGPEMPEDRYVEVAALPNRSGGRDAVVRTDGARHHGGGRPASLDEIVKAYLLGGRQRQQDRAA
jgi:ABC-2 type transport system ATP-binding protein